MIDPACPVLLKGNGYPNILGNVFMKNVVIFNVGVVEMRVEKI